MVKSQIFDTVIIGSGPAGYTAAIYAARSSLKTLIISGVSLGGQLMLTTDVDDYPGFPQGVQGPDLMEQMKKQTQRFDAKIVQEDVTNSDFSKKPFKLITNSGSEFLGRTVIITTGASAKWLGLENERRLIGKGVSSCAVCDGAFFKNKAVAVVGGGDTAMRETLFLAKFASKIYIIHRKSKFRSFPALQAKIFDLLKQAKVDILWNREIEDVLGKEKVEGVRLRESKTKKVINAPLALDGLFVAIGHKPNTEIFKNQIELDDYGYVKVVAATQTSVDGVFAAGDCVDFKYQQAVTAAGSGCMAALDADEYLSR